MQNLALRPSGIYVARLATVGGATSQQDRKYVIRSIGAVAASF